MILPVVAPDSLTGDKAVSVLVPRLGMSQIGHGDTVQFNVDGVLRYALVVGASSRGRVKCLLWYRADDLPEAIQFNGLSVGASFAGSHSTLELVLSTTDAAAAAKIKNKYKVALIILRGFLYVIYEDLHTGDQHKGRARERTRERTFLSLISLILNC